MTRGSLSTPLRKALRAVRRRSRRPVVSVVIPCRDAEPYIEAAVRSVLNQSLRDVEVIVVDDGSQDGSFEVVRGLADRDRRVRLIRGDGRGPGAARNRGVELAAGKYLAFVDADDVMLAGALETMVGSARRTRSDVVTGAYRRHSAIGSHRPKLTARVHAEERLAVSAEQFPELLDEPVLWNGLYRTSFWRAKVHPIPEDVNYEDQEPSLRAALQARSVDVLAVDVYSWRLPEGRATRSQSKSSLADIQDRRTVLHRMQQTLDEEHVSGAVRQHLLAVWLGRDLLMYAEKVPIAEPRFREELRAIGAELIAEIDAETWQAFPFWERLTAWALSQDDPEMLDDVLATRWEETSAVPLELDAATGELRCTHPLLDRLSGVPEPVRRVSPRDLHLVCTARKMRFADARTCAFKAEVHVAGLDPLRTALALEIAATAPDGTRGPAATIASAKAGWADQVSNDPWRSYARAGIRAEVELLDVPAQQIHVRTQLGGHLLEAAVPQPVTSLNYRLGPVEKGKQFSLSAADGGAAEFTAVGVSPFVLVKARSQGEEMELVVRCTDEERALHDVQVVARRQGNSIRGVVGLEGHRLRIRLPLPPVPDGTLYRGERAYTVDVLAGGEQFPVSWDRNARAERGTALRAVPTRDGRVKVEKRAVRVTVDDVAVDGSTARFSGRVDPSQHVPVMWLVSSTASVPMRTVPAKSGRWSADLDLSDRAIASGGYFVRWSASEQEEPAGWARAGRALRKGEHYVEGPCRSVRLSPHRGGALGVTLGAPLRSTERTRVGRRRLITASPGPLRPGVFFESFNGKSSGDNPRALLDALRPLTEVPLWWSVADGTVPVPPGATPVVAGSAPWFEALRTARVLVTNNNFPHWFEKRPGQVILQTWHGTPIKRLLFDAPPAFTPLVYRRLMARQAEEWDLLLVQDEEAEHRLRSALRYEGPVHRGELLRNIRLDQEPEGRARVRSELGIPLHQPAVLYTPTWREKMRGTDGEQALQSLVDVASLADATGAHVMVRSHHMNGLRADGAGVTDVSAYPHVEDLMLASDVLVSDYSSIVYDYRLTGRPMIVHAPDLRWYRDVERGFYGHWPDDLGLPLSQDQDSLEDLVAEALATDEPRKPPVNGAEKSLEWTCGWVLDALRDPPGSHSAQQHDKKPFRS